MPAITFAQALAARGIQCEFWGGAHGLEAQLVPAAGVAFSVLPSQPLFGANILRTLRIPYALLRGRAQARQRMLAKPPALVVGFGGHASVAPVLAARELGIPTAIYEANARAGVSNALLAPIVDRVFVAEPHTQFPLPPRSLERIGRVLRKELETAPVVVRRLPTDRSLRILVLSGSQGSRFLNQRAADVLAVLRAHDVAFHVWHQAGLDANLESIHSHYQRTGISARVDGYLPDLHIAYAWADFAISAAGAGSIAELSAHALPALWIPLEDVARDHQAPNARAHQQRTGALVCAQRDFAPVRLARQLASVLTSPRRYQQLVDGLLSVQAAGGTERMVASCLAIPGVQSAPPAQELSRMLRSEVFSRSADNDAASVPSQITRPARSAMPRSHKA
jgi:UDP-N-acetylglucosamine--N-acetylmuramyl-(pentapeptide) pyrophosphoryl-undecaprenol N-acetylglucosamine transferase